MITDTAQAQSWENQLEETASDLTKNDRFSAVLVLVVIFGAIGLGLLMQQSTLNQTWSYSNQQAGIDAAYSAGWLVDEGETYVARMLDPKARPFKTQYTIAVAPAGGQTSIR